MGVVGIYLLATRSPGHPEGWSEDFASAQREAVRSNKKLLVAFSMPGCPPCRMMERSVLPAPPVKEALTGYVAVHVDATRNGNLAERMGVAGTPTYIVASSDGTPLLSASGYLPVESFVAFLKQGVNSSPAGKPGLPPDSAADSQVRGVAPASPGP